MKDYYDKDRSASYRIFLFALLAIVIILLSLKLHPQKADNMTKVIVSSEQSE